MTREDLDRDLCAAHDSGDLNALIALYTLAADRAEAEEAAGFYLTNAMVFALEAGRREAATLHQRLVKIGRSDPGHI